MSYASLIPEELKALLLQVRGAGDAEFWTVGDVAAALEDDAEGNPDKQRALRNAISDIAGVTPKIVGEYKAHAKFYPPLVRELFPTLTRWHYRHSKRAGSLRAAFDWLCVAEASADEYGGSPMPVRVLGAKMGRGNSDKPLTRAQLIAWAAAWKRAAKKYREAAGLLVADRRRERA